ncbi:MAG: metallophosphoesterase [Alphaproteobacteria bacterium]|nr:metallophosphoesterase [Alphaproteobacteria bacterium]MBQ3514136.1 metallophosphoesterase [Lachnospiraceae bacterium]
MSDIHGCLAEFEVALSLVMEHLEEAETMLILMGDYIHGGSDNYGVLDKIMKLQNRYGLDKVLALMGNHEEFVLWGDSTINHMIKTFDEEQFIDEGMEDKYIQWMENLPRYYTAGNTIFVHAGIDEEAGDLWEWGTGDEFFVGKYPAETGKIEGLAMKVVAGHVGTAEIVGNPSFHDIYYDGESHYYIDGTVLDSGVIPVLMVDTDTDKYYRVTETGNWLILPYDEEN